MKSIRLFFIVVLFFVLGLNRSYAQQDVLEPLPPNSIQLDGFLDQYIDNSIEHWNKGVVPYERFVDFYREGRPQFALGEMWGKAVRSACMFYRYNHDGELKKIIDATVKDLLSTQRSNGSISCVPIEKQPEESELWERKYVMLGLEEYYNWVDSSELVLNALRKQADNIISLVGHAPKTEITDIGWSATNIGYEPCHIESSTLLEPFMRLYNLTNDQRYLDFASYIVKMGGTKYYNVFEMAYNNVAPYKMAGHYPKAYEMLSLFEGLVEYYRVTQKPEVKQMIMNLYNNVQKREITIIGNGGSDQPYHPQVAGEAWGNTAIEQTNPKITRMMETCIGVTWLKFCSQVLRLTGDPLIVDEMEKYIYNGLLGAMKPSGDGFSYVNLFNGVKVNDHGWGWKFDDLHVTCCNLNGPMGLAYIPFVAVMKDSNGPIVNLYNANKVNMKSPKGQALGIRTITDFPHSGNIKINIELIEKERFNIKLRIPQWSKNTIVKVNGIPQNNIKAGTYLNISRIWRNNDVIDIEFEMKCLLIQAPKGSDSCSQNFQALKWGPIVLARDENIDENYNKPVQIISDQNQVVSVQKVKPILNSTNFEFLVPTDKGLIRVSDYASINNWNGKHICTWIPLK